MASFRLEETVQPLRDVIDSMQGWMLQIGSFLERAEATLGRLFLTPPVLQTAPKLRPLVVPDVGFADGSGADLFGRLSPTVRASSTVMAPMLQLMPELQELCGEPVLPLSVQQMKADSSFLERADELTARLDIASMALARVTLPCSPVEGPLPHVVVEPPSAIVEPVAIEDMVPLHGGDEAWNEGTSSAADASPTFTLVTPSSSSPSPVGSQCLLHLSRDSPYLVRDISAEFEPTPLGMPVTSPPPAPAVHSGGLVPPPPPQEDLLDGWTWSSAP
jgi:hypothetical protein